MLLFNYIALKAAAGYQGAWGTLRFSAHCWLHPGSKPGRRHRNGLKPPPQPPSWPPTLEITPQTPDRSEAVPVSQLAPSAGRGDWGHTKWTWSDSSSLCRCQAILLLSQGKTPQKAAFAFATKKKIKKKKDICVGFQACNDFLTGEAFGQACGLQVRVKAWEANCARPAEHSGFHSTLVAAC